MVAIIPMAGRGSRYAKEGYSTPKPLIEIGGKPMIYWALKSLEGIQLSRVVFVLLREHEVQFQVRNMLTSMVGQPVSFVLLDEVTDGQLCTVLAAKEFMKEDEDVLVAASDTWVQSHLVDDVLQPHVDGLISVAHLPGEQWSFARTDDTGRVVEVAEKVRISDQASTGLYYFSRAGDLIRFGEEMIARKEKTRGEYYVIPVYQKMIEAGLHIGISNASAMWDMGTPEAKKSFEHYLSTR